NLSVSSQLANGALGGFAARLRTYGACIGVKCGFSLRTRLANIVVVVSLGFVLVVCTIAQRSNETDKLCKQRWVLFEFARKGATDFSIGFGSQPLKQGRNRLADLGNGEKACDRGIAWSGIDRVQEPFSET